MAQRGRSRKIITEPAEIVDDGLPFDQKRLIEQLLNMVRWVADDGKDLLLVGGVTHAEAQFTGMVPVFEFMFLQRPKLFPGDEDQVMDIVDIMSQQKDPTIRLGVAKNLTRLHPYIAKQDRMPDVLARLCHDEDERVRRETGDALFELDLPTPVKPAPTSGFVSNSQQPE